jgi:hypothetical protein
MGTKKKFSTNKYILGKKKLKNGRTMHYATCKAPSGCKAFLIVGKDFKG